MPTVLAVVDVAIREEKLIVTLDDGRSISFPLEWYPRLLHASPKDGRIGTFGDGYAIEWPDLDEHIGIEGLLAGRRSGESRKSFARWLALGGDPLNTKSHSFS
jgi:hypothetical protein